MPNLLDRFKNFINKNDLFQTNHKLLIAVSGGVDSIVLTHLLKEAGYYIGIVHCNFGLRGLASDQDEVLVQSLSIKMNVPFFCKKMNTEHYAATHKVSIQMAARDLRYEWFNQLLTEEKFDYLITAHHANDQVETILFNLIKGTGTAGLRGIKPINQQIVRPLLFASKQEIINYATEDQLTWREDTSNQSGKYHRNRIRNQVIPELRLINPALEETMQDTTNRFSSLEHLLTAQADKIKREYMKIEHDHVLDLSWFDLKTGGLAVLEEILKPYGFNWRQCEQMIESMHISGKRFISNTHILAIDRNQLIIDAKNDVVSVHCMVTADTTQVNIDHYHYNFELIKGQVKPSKDSNCAFLDYNQLTFPLTIRSWEEGDRFTPLGMNGQKKISDFMIDEKIPVNLKKRVLLFESQGEIIWIAGYRISDRHKITSKTTQILLIKRTENAKPV